MHLSLKRGPMFQWCRVCPTPHPLTHKTLARPHVYGSTCPRPPTPIPYPQPLPSGSGSRAHPSLSSTASSLPDALRSTLQRRQRGPWDGTVRQGTAAQQLQEGMGAQHCCGVTVVQRLGQVREGLAGVRQ